MAGDQSASFDGQDDAIAPFTKIHERGDKNLSEAIAGMLESLNPPPASSRKHDCCIYKVPDHIRKSNKEAYTPQVISIGPFHRDNPNLQKNMEDFKLRYLNSFTKRDPKMNLEELVSTIRVAEKSVRECYSETTTLGSDDFVTMILVDACFIIEYFLKNKSKIWTEYDREILEPGLCNRMQMDLILLENQLPFFIIEKIYDTALPSRSNGGHPFIELCFCQFEYYNVQEFDHHDLDRDSGSSGIFILHFTDLLRHFCMPPRRRRPEGSSELSIKEMHSAAQLDEVRLMFKMSKPSKNRSPLELKYKDGVLEIPRLQLDDTTEIYARNLVALEKCHYPKDQAYITDYYTLLGFLIKTGKDLDVLVREQIIDNWLDGVVATSMINKLSGEKGFYIKMNSHYHEMAEELNEFYNNPPKLIPLIRFYFARFLFRTWLAGTFTITGSVGLFLTAVGSACSVLSLKYK